MNVKHLVVALVLASCGGLGTGGTEFDVVARTEPAITAIHTDDGFTQIRQNAIASVVIEGKRLADTSSVSIGAFFAQIDSVAEDEVRVTVFADSSQPLGPIAVSVTTDAGTATKAHALTFTPFVVAPTAVTGHGTFQSPTNLCDPEIEFTGPGTTVQLLAGTHHCDRQISIGAGTTVRGDPQATTIVTGTETGGFGIAIFGSEEAVTTIRDLTFAPPLAGSSIELDQGSLVVERVADAGGISTFGGGAAAIDHYAYEGEGTGLDLLVGHVTRSTIRHCGTGDGIRAAAGRSAPNGNSVTLDHVVVEDCQRGLVVGGRSDAPVAVGVSATDSRFIDNAVGIRIEDGLTTLRDVVVRGDEATPRVSSTGISIANGNLTMIGGKIAGQDSAGIDVIGSCCDTHTTLDVEGVLIAGGQVGIDFNGLDNQMVLRGSTVRAQTQAAIRISALDSLIDMGELGDPGNNALSVKSGFVIDDTRFGTSSFDRYIRATGTTLNRVSFDGQTIDGPAELAPYYRILDFDSGIQF